MFQKILIANRGEIAVRDHPGLPEYGNPQRCHLLQGG